MTKSIQELREKRKAKAQELHDLHGAEGAWSDEKQTKFDETVKDVEDLDRQIENHEKSHAIMAKNKERIDQNASVRGVSDDEAENSLDIEKGIFNTYLRGGHEALNEEQRNYANEKKARIQNALSTGAPSEGGVLAPDQFSADLKEELKAFGGMRSVAEIMTTDDGNKIDFPTTDATSEEGEILDENAQATDEDPDFGTVPINAYMFSSKGVPVPWQLLQDSKIDIEAHLRKRLGTRLGRVTNRMYTVGTGVNQPKGAVVASSLGHTGALTDGVTFDDFIEMEHSVDPAYRQAGVVSWMFNDDTLKIGKKLKDNQGRPIWLPGLNAGDPNEILGYSYTINQDMAKMAASEKSMLFGDMSKYVIRDVMNIILLRMTDSHYSRRAQVGFLAFMRSDGNLIDSSASGIKHFQNAA